MQQINRFQRLTLVGALCVFCSYTSGVAAAIKHAPVKQNSTSAAGVIINPLKGDLSSDAANTKPQDLEHSVNNDDFLSLVPEFSTQKKPPDEWDESLPLDQEDETLSISNHILPEFLNDKESEKLMQSRETFKAAVKALNRGKHQTFKKLSAKISDYPLYPYLKYYELRRYLAHSKQKHVNKFVKENADLAVIPHLKKAWLKTLADKKKWSDYLDYYELVTSAENPLVIRSPRLKCYYHWSQFKQGKVAEAFAGAESLWLVGKSQDKSCDPLFAKWRNSNLFSETFIWKRIQLATAERQYRLARFLAKSLDSEQQQRVAKWISLHRHPEKLIAKAPYLADTVERTDMVFSVLMRLIEKDPVKAIATWELFEAKLHFSVAQSQDFKITLATILELRGLPEAEEWLVEANPEGDNELLNQLAIRRALTKDDWGKVAQLIDKLPEAQKYSSQSRYWYARALEALAKQDTETQDGTLQADIIFQQLANERSYYGFLASQKSKLPMRLVPMPVSIQKSEIKALKAKPALQRAHEFFHLGQFVNGRREWNRALASMSDKEKLVAAKLASEWNWHSEAIRSASKSSYRDRLNLRFPLAHSDIIAEQAEKTGLAMDWIYAIIRQESMFMSDARSHVGATGMMQLLPSTAKRVARAQNLPYRGLQDLLNPEKNIVLGTLYMSQMMQRFNNNIVLATAAYNAGPHRVDKWLANEHYPESIPGDVWIEMIPFKETRHYVKQVLSYQVIYQHLMGDEPDLLSSIQVISAHTDAERETITD